MFAIPGFRLITPVVPAAIAAVIATAMGGDTTTAVAIRATGVAASFESAQGSAFQYLGFPFLSVMAGSIAGEAIFPGNPIEAMKKHPGNGMLFYAASGKSCRPG